METAKAVDLGEGKVSRLLFQLALPAITAQIINVLYNMVDRMYIGHIPRIGAQALTGVGVTMPVIMAVSAFASLVSMGGAPRASIMMGKKQPREAEKILGGCTFALILISLILTVVLRIFGRNILMVFGASDHTVGYALDYLNIYCLGTAFVQLALGLNAFITAQGFARISMYTVLLGAVCNIVLDPVFIFGFKMGVRGAALATVLSQGISTLWVIRFLTSKKSVLCLKKEDLRFAPKVVLPCMALGVSPFIMQFTESVLSVSFNTSLLKYGGDIAVGAMTILSSVMQFSMLPLQGLTQGAQPITSYNYGAGKKARVKDIFRILLVSCVFYSSLIWCFSMFTPSVLARIFTSDKELIEFTVWAMRIYMGASCIFGIQIACQQTFIALGNAKASVFLALLRKVILLIPLIFILPIFLPNQVMAVFLAEPVADTLAVTTTGILFFITFKKTLDRMEG